jgi:hypothetical protein
LIASKIFKNITENLSKKGRLKSGTLKEQKPVLKRAIQRFYYLKKKEQCQDRSPKSSILCRYAEL